MTTARLLLHALRVAGVSIRADGRELVLKPAANLPADLIGEIRIAKAELLFVLAGDYTRAAKSLLVREVADDHRRQDLALDFDERVAMAHVGEGITYGDACRLAYRELCDVLETTGVQSAKEAR